MNVSLHTPQKQLKFYLVSSILRALIVKMTTILECDIHSDAAHCPNVLPQKTQCHFPRTLLSWKEKQNEKRQIGSGAT